MANQPIIQITCKLLNHRHGENPSEQSPPLRRIFANDCENIENEENAQKDRHHPAQDGH